MSKEPSLCMNLQIIVLIFSVIFHLDPAMCSTLDSRGSSLPMRMEPPPSYDHLSRTGAIHSISDDMESCPSSPYDQLDRSFSWGRRGFTKEAGYTVIDEPKGNSFSNTYDHLDRVVPGQRVVVSASCPTIPFNSSYRLSSILFRKVVKLQMPNEKKERKGQTQMLIDYFFPVHCSRKKF